MEKILSSKKTNITHSDFCDEISNDTCWNVDIEEEQKFELIFLSSPESLLSDSNLSNSSSPLEFNGWNTPDKEKNTKIQNLIENIESDEIEIDEIDGYIFESFLTEIDLMNYSRLQQCMRSPASQSDDGLEMMDDASFSDISSSRAIIPTKTKDITRIKGWRNKHFAGIAVYDDSESSVKNEDDGFGEDFEINPFQDETSDVEFSDCQVSSASNNERSGFLNYESHHKLPNVDLESSSSKIKISFEEETGKHLKGLKEDNASIFGQSNESSVSNPSIKNKTISPNPNRTFTFGSDVAVEKEKCSVSNPISPFLSNKSLDTYQFSKKTLSTEERKMSTPSLSHTIYKPRVKLNLIESIAKKVLGGTQEDSSCETSLLSKSVCKSEGSRGFHWRVPKDSLLSGSIFDLEIASKKEDLANQSTSKISPTEETKPSFVKNIKASSSLSATNKDKVVSVFVGTLDESTIKTDELHIGFTVEKLDAADNITHGEDTVLLPEQNSPTLTPPRVSKPANEIKAKTAAEKRKILESIKETEKRKLKLSYKLKDQLDDHKNKKIQSNNRKDYGSLIKDLKSKSKSSYEDLTNKKIQSNERRNYGSLIKKLNGKSKSSKEKENKIKYCFDDQGAITYGREKPLQSILQGLLPPQNKGDVEQSLNKNPYGMVLNVGIKRPLYKEASDNIQNRMTNDGIITKEGALFAAAAFQHSVQGPFIVTRFVASVVDESLKHLASTLEPLQSPTQKRLSSNRNSEKELKYFDTKTKANVPQNIKMCPESLEFKQLICDTINDVINYVEKKEYFDQLKMDFDPDIPAPKEEESFALQSTPKQTISKKKKRSGLQREIALLGGTFISVEEDDTEHLEPPKPPPTKKCENLYCLKGCVCSFLKGDDKSHCGKASCIFECICQNSQNHNLKIKNKIWLLPKVMHLQMKHQSKLAPVEREFHQTVIMSKNSQTITVETNSKKRERKRPSKYMDGVILNPKLEPEVLLPEDFVAGSRRKPLPGKSRSEDEEEVKECSVSSISNDSKESTSQHLLAKKKGVQNLNKPFIQNESAKTSDSSCLLNFENHCSRTNGVTQDYSQRNMMCKLKLKNMVLYAGEHLTDEFCNNQDDSVWVKDDLEIGSLNDFSVENSVDGAQESDQESDSGLAIAYVCSLSKEKFSNRGTVGRSVESSTISLDSSRSSDGNEVMISSETLTKSKNEKIVSATLPIMKSECKWWVIEVNADVFSYLVYVSDKRSLFVGDIMKLILNAESGNKPLRIPLNNPYSSHRNIFGAYAVPGQKQLVFLGPYELHEKHSITAVKKLESNRFVWMPFSSNLSSSAGFKSLVSVAENAECSKQISEKCVKAVWWHQKAKLVDLATDKCTVVPSSSTSIDSNKSVLNTNSQNQPVLNSENTNSVKQNFANYSVNTQKDTTEISKNIQINPSDLDKFNLSYSKALKDLEMLQSKFKDFQSKKELEKKEAEKNTENKTPLNSSKGTLKKRARQTKKKLNQSHKKPERQAYENKMTFSYENPKRPRILKHREAPKTSIQKSSEQNVLKRSAETAGGLGKRKSSINHSNTQSKKKQTKHTSRLEFEVSDSFGSSDDDGLMIDMEEDTWKPRKKLVHESTKKRDSSIQKQMNLPDNLMMKSANILECPSHALVCLTPGVGYIAVKTFSPGSLVIDDPGNKDVEHEFANQYDASDWLVAFFNEKLRYSPKAASHDRSWRLVKGALIKRLQPLNRAIFWYTPKTLEVTEKGLELPNFAKEFSEKSFPEKKLILNRNSCERERRFQIKMLLSHLETCVFAQSSQNRSQLSILNQATMTIEAQKTIGAQLKSEFDDETTKKRELNEKLKQMLADIRDYDERTKALNFCRNYRISQIDQYIDDSDALSAAMMAREWEVIKSIHLNKITKKIHFPTLVRNISPESGRSSGSPSISSGSASPVPRQGMLVKRKPPRPSPTVTSEVILLTDSDNEKQQDVIEIPSDDNADVEVIPIPSQDSDDDIAITSVTINKKKRRRVKRIGRRKKAKSVVKPSFVNFDNSVSGEMVDPLSSAVMSPETITSDRVSPVAMVLSHSKYDQHVGGSTDFGDRTFLPLNASNRINITPLQMPSINLAPPQNPNLTAVHKVLSNSFTTFSRTYVGSADNEPEEILPDISPKDSSSNIVKVPTTPPVHNSLLQIPGISSAECKNITPIGRVISKSSLQGKSILLTTSRNGIKLSKLPTPKPVSLLKSKPVNLQLSNSHPVSLLPTSPASSSDTVTLHHPSEQISETRSVQFKSMNSVRVVNPLVQSVREETTININVLVPKKH